MSNKANHGKTQQQIETQLSRLPPRETWDDKAGLKTIFGAEEDWILTLGPRQLFLNPANRRWLFFHLGYEEWMDTGYNAGEVAFVLKDNVLYPEPAVKAKAIRRKNATSTKNVRTKQKE